MESPSKYAILMKNSGYGCTSSKVKFDSIFGKEIDKVNEEHVAQIIGMMIMTQTGLEPRDRNDKTSDNKWNHKNLYKWLSEKKKFDNLLIIKNLDYEGFMVNDQQGLKIILDLYTPEKIKNEFPLEVLWGRWKNYKGQYSILKQVILSQSEIFNYQNIYINPILTMDNPSLMSISSAKTILLALVGQVWNSVDLMSTLLNLAETDIQNEILEMFQIASKQSPELLLLGLVQSHGLPWNKHGNSELQERMIMNLMNLFLNGHPSSSIVLFKLWQISPNVLISGLLNMYNNDQSLLSRILDIAQEVKGLSQILETKYDAFVIDLASLASRRDYLNLEKWLQDHILEQGDSFIKSCMEFLNKKIVSLIDKNENGAQVQCVLLSSDVVTIFLKVLMVHLKNMSAINSNTFRMIIIMASRAYPKLANANILESIPIIQQQQQQQLQQQQQALGLAQDVEDEAGSYFEKVYKNQISIAQMVELMKKFKMSNIPRENEVFACMIKSIFDEYKYLSSYPEKELILTSVLFGTLVQQKIISQVSLGMALKYVLDSLKQTVNTKYYKFGVNALIQFQQRLCEWPQYCACLLQITQLQQTNPEIVANIKNIQKQDMGMVDSKIDKIAIGNNAVLPMGMETEEVLGKDGMDTPIFTSVKLDALKNNNDKYEIPIETIKDKILFIVNNVSISNLDSKAKEMKGLLRENYFIWFSKYLVVKRASIEPNFHSLYISLLDAIEIPLLNKFVLHETYINIYMLLNSKKCLTSSSERTLLKNLGTWLGGITLAKNKPIKHKNLAFKELLLEGYDNNVLIIVIPFVCKTLEQVKSSTVFKPPNPWLMAIIKLLIELYNYADLKLNLKFEIEVLCKNLDIDMTKIETTSILKDRQQAKMFTSATDQLVKEYKKMAISKMAQSPIMDNSVNLLASENDSVAFPNLISYLVFNQNSIVFTTHPISKKIVHLAFDHAIDEIIKLFIDRSAAIVGIVTSELIKKDFNLEPNEEKMRKAAYMMAQNLAGNLISVSCKEELRIGMYTYLSEYINKYKFMEVFSEQEKYTVVNDNIDIACTIVEKAAIEKALICVEENLAASFNTRRKHRERGQPFCDYNTYSQLNYPPSFPDALRLKQTGITNQQFYIYEEFTKSSQEILDRNYRQYIESNLMKPEIPNNIKAQIISQENAKETHQIQQCLEKISQIMIEIEKLINENSTKTFNLLPENHEIIVLMSQILPIINKPISSEEIAFHLSQKTVQQLYKTEYALGREVYALILEKLCSFSKKVMGEVVAWLLYSEEERKYNVDATLVLIRVKLLNFVELDIQLARLVENSKKPSIIKYSTELIRKALFDKPQIATYNDFINTIEVFYYLAEHEKATEEITELLKEINKSIYITQENIDNGLFTVQQKFNLYFKEWVKLYSSSLTNEKLQAQYIIQLQQKDDMKNENNSSLFFRICTEESITNNLVNGTMDVKAINAYARLIVLYIRYNIDTADTKKATQKDVITKILSVIVLILVNTHEKYQRDFNQTPFFRFFSSLLTELNTYEKYLEPVNFQIFSAMSNTFHTLQPSYLPGFTYSWLELISHRLFMPKLLSTEKQRGWPYYQRLLIDLFKFFNSFLIHGNKMKDNLNILYSGTLSLFLVLLHDFPEFLSEHYFGLIDAIPTSCVQLRNLILCAFPTTRLPDPFDPSLKIESIPEINKAPIILSDYTASLMTNNFKQDIDNYLKNRSPVSFLLDLSKHILYSNQNDIATAGTKYNIPLINSLVLYIGVQDILYSSKPNQSGFSSVHSASQDIFQQLIINTDIEGRYYFLSAFANQLRYPNSHTGYFINTLLNLFAETNQEIIKEQITRVLLERIIVNRPHPWGLLYTLYKLTKEEKYGFWTDKNNSKYNETEKLYESIASVILDKAQYSNFLKY